MTRRNPGREMAREWKYSVVGYDDEIHVYPYRDRRAVDVYAVAQVAASDAMISRADDELMFRLMAELLQSSVNVHFHDCEAPHWPVAKD
jgi:hypothetical protein